MVDNDIYNNKAKYERLINNLDKLVLPKDKRPKGCYKSKYQIKNKDNLAYFKRLAAKFEAQDLSYIRRKRILETLLNIANLTEKDFKDLINDEEETDKIISKLYSTNKSIVSQCSVISMTKRVWNILFKEIGYWKEIRVIQDRSKQRQRKDKLLPKEYKQLLQYFKNDIETKLIISLTTES